MKVFVLIIKWIGILLLSLLTLYVAICLIMYRLPAGKGEIVTEQSVHYKFIEFAGTNRQFFEELIMQNKTLRLQDKSVWFISKDQRDILWSESPHAMSEKGYTIKVKIKAKKLYFGGYGKATVMSFEKINEQPIISK